jgi:hypothetical protein
MVLRKRGSAANRVRSISSVAVAVAIVALVGSSARPAVAGGAVDLGPQPVPTNLLELEALPSDTKLKTQGVPVVGTAISLIELLRNQDDQREMDAAHRTIEHHSLLARRAARQETQPDPSPIPGATPTAGPPAPLGEREPAARAVVVLHGSYRPGEMTAYVQSIGGSFEPCGVDYSPFCGRVMIDRPGGPKWLLPQKTIVARNGYVIEGYDSNGPECAAFQLTFEPLPPDSDGVAHVRFGLRSSPTWQLVAPADCTMTLYEIPRPPAAN